MVVGVVGANGFIGRNICTHHILRKNKVYAFVKSHYDKVPKECQLVLSDQPCSIDLDCLFVAVGNYSLSPEQHLTQTQEVFKIVSNLKFKKVIFISSTAVYGNHNSPIELSSTYNNPNLYGTTKLFQECLIKQFPNYSIVRPTYVYGNGMGNNSLIPTWIKSAVESQTITVLGNGSRTQDYIHISDLLHVCDQAFQENGVMLAATGQSISNLELAELICDAVQSTIKFNGEDNSPSFEFKTDSSFPFKNISQGIKELIEYEVSNL